MDLPLFAGVLCWSLFWYALLFALSSLAIILTRKRVLVAVNVLWHFLAVPLVGLQFVTVFIEYN